MFSTVEREAQKVDSLGARAHAVAHQFAALVLVSLGAAFFAVGFRWLLQVAFVTASGAGDVVMMFERLPGAARVALPAVGGLFAGIFALLLARSARSQGVGDVMEAVVFGRVQLSMRSTLLKSIGSWFAIASGGSIGREGPLIQFGGTWANAVLRALRIPESRGRSLVAAGTAAGFAAAYNTPIAAVVFVLEIVTGVVTVNIILDTVTATAIATAITRVFVGGGPIYGQREFTLSGHAELASYAVLGVVAALGAQGFMRMLSQGESLFERSPLGQPWRAAVGGLFVGAIALFLPQVTGNGYEPLNAMLDGHIPFGLVLWLLVAKAVATTASVSSGSPGGIFTPTLFVGAAIGVVFQHATTLVVGHGALGSPGAYALVGMAATTAATMHAPLMATVLVFELSGDYAIVLPLLLATASATTLSRLMRSESVYGAELRKRGIAWEMTLDGRRMQSTPEDTSSAVHEEGGAGQPKSGTG